MSERLKPESVFDRFRARAPSQGLPRRMARRGENPSDFRPAKDRFPPHVSVIILTYNEEVNVERALSSVSGSADVVVLDSGSSDQTVQLATSAGATVVHRAFTTSAEQRQWALDNIDFTNEWLLVLDADEWVPLNFAGELKHLTLSASDGLSGAWCRLRFVHEGAWVPSSSLYPTWQMRVLRRGAVAYESRSVNSHPRASGTTARMEHDLVHEDLRSSSLRVRKLESRARLEALEMARIEANPFKAMVHAAATRRRLKILSAFVPFRPFLLTMHRFLRGGWREGRPGARFIADYYFFVRLVQRYRREIWRQPNAVLKELGLSRPRWRRESR